MTERAWLEATRPWPMLERLGASASSRKRRLVGVEACHRLWNVMTDPRSRRAVTVADQFADGKADVFELFAANEAAIAVGGSVVERTAARVSAAPAEFSLDVVLGHAGAAAQNRTERKFHCALVREVFGNPFRSAVFAPDWRTGTAVALALAMYDAREFSAMPILADALQDAGCDNDDVLAHCRDTSLTHVRGCWVCDLVLGKA